MTENTLDTLEFTDGPGGCPWVTGGIPELGVEGVPPAALLAPRSLAEAAAALAAASARGVPVYPMGRAVHLRSGAPWAAAGWVVWTGRLVAPVDHQPQDLTVTVQAGHTLTHLSEVLARSGQRLPYEPPGRGASTVGGLAALHAPGLTRLGHGPLRDRILGMTVALSTGEIAKTGGRTVKNVAGYDLHRLHAGGRGTLGLTIPGSPRRCPGVAGEVRLGDRTHDPGARLARSVGPGDVGVPRGARRFSSGARRPRPRDGSAVPPGDAADQPAGGHLGGGSRRRRRHGGS
ncbi:MAG: FAD-binding oxidoreductase [Candidatus Riflebacteria bacterium]|nr:FAD-binding oxidoreductase [Candidatus Riflebacteria bacterium]